MANFLNQLFPALEGSQSIVSGAAENVGDTLREIYSLRPQAKYASGARCTLKINGELAAFATAISWRITTETREIRTIDNPLPVELVPTMVSVEGTIGGLRLPGQSPTQNLIMPDVLSFLFHKYITIEVRDSKTDQLLFLTGKAQITGRMEELKSESLGSIALTWKAIGWRDERDPILPEMPKESPIPAIPAIDLQKIAVPGAPEISALIPTKSLPPTAVKAIYDAQSAGVPVAKNVFVPYIPIIKKLP